MDSVSILKSIAIVGEVDAGKSALLACLLDEQDVFKGKTQAATYYHDQVIDTPGEFIDNRAWYGALLSTISSVDIIVYLQPANASRLTSPPNILRVYPDKHVVAVISKIDLPDANIDKIKQMLKTNNIHEPYFCVSINQPDTIVNLKNHLLKMIAEINTAKTNRANKNSNKHITKNFGV